VRDPTALPKRHWRLPRSAVVVLSASAWRRGRSRNVVTGRGDTGGVTPHLARYARQKARYHNAAMPSPGDRPTYREAPSTHATGENTGAQARLIRPCLLVVEASDSSLRHCASNRPERSSESAAGPTKQFLDAGGFRGKPRRRRPTLCGVSARAPHAWRDRVRAGVKTRELSISSQRRVAPLKVVFRSQQSFQLRCASCASRETANSSLFPPWCQGLQQSRAISGLVMLHLEHHSFARASIDRAP